MTSGYANPHVRYGLSRAERRELAEWRRYAAQYRGAETAEAIRQHERLARGHELAEQAVMNASRLHREVAVQAADDLPLGMTLAAIERAYAAGAAAVIDQYMRGR